MRGARRIYTLDPAPQAARRRSTMTRLSGYLLPTEKQPPADAEAASHKLMVRAGLIRQMGAGMWSWLPAGWRSHERVVAIVREEMDAIGAQEMLMPVLQPADPWRATGRLDIEALFKLTDRKGSELVLAMTHEEAVTFHVAQIVRSYRDLPLILYHFQVKARDEPRPRAGVLRTREFFMLGTRYSEPLGARFLDEHGSEQTIWMGSYGIGPARIVAAAVEQFADEHGISWPRALAPFAVHLVAIGAEDSEERRAADELYASLCAGGVEVLYDDRDSAPGEKFADADLLGCPLRLT